MSITINGSRGLKACLFPTL